MNENWTQLIEIGKLPMPIQHDLSEWCKQHRTGDPLLTSVERWTVYEIVRVWLDYHGIVSQTHLFLVLMDAINSTKTR